MGVAAAALQDLLQIGLMGPRHPCGGAVRPSQRTRRINPMQWLAYPSWLSPGDNAWQMTAATFVGLMSVPGLVVLYGGVMQKRWSINSMMLTFAAFATVLVVWMLWGFKMGFGSPFHGLAHHGFFANIVGKPGPSLGHSRRAGPGGDPAGDDRTELQVPAGVAGVLPVRVRRHHADPDAGLRARPDQLQGVGSVRGPLDLGRLRRRCVRDLGRRLVRPARRGRLLRRVCDPPLGRYLRASWPRR